jgi:glycosyltransferase involved in cell wall biosynthesis
MANKRARVLIVGMLDSIHLARWLKQFSESEIDFVLFPSTPHRRIHGQIKSLIKGTGLATYIIVPGMKMLALPLTIADLFLANRIRGKILQLLINKSRYEFDVIHSHETQHAGYLTEIAIRNSQRKPNHILSIWGSDLYWFKQFKKHRTKIQSVLQNTNQLILECHRDVVLANELGYKGNEPILISASGGFGVDEIELGSKSLRTSDRKTILVKGYLGFVGRADVALSAIKEIYAELDGYRVVVYSTDFRTRRIIDTLKRDTGLAIQSYKKHQLNHTSMLALFRESRIHIGISASDGMPGSLREAMLNGCIPIQSDTSCANEWFTDKKDGFLVTLNSNSGIVNAIRKCISDDAWVDRAAIKNRSVAITQLAKISPNDMKAILYGRS